MMAAPTRSGREIKHRPGPSYRALPVRTWPVRCLPVGSDLVLLASAGGAPRHPGWYLNLRANPRVTIRLADRVQAMSVRTSEGAERARLWERFVRQYPRCADYQRSSGRVIPVVVLTPLRHADPTAPVERRRR
jgi:deazaflavin-dependent oxidoreductase (nitroreductase family)